MFYTLPFWLLCLDVFSNLSLRVCSKSGFQMGLYMSLHQKTKTIFLCILSLKITIVSPSTIGRFLFVVKISKKLPKVKPACRVQ